MIPPLPGVSDVVSTSVEKSSKRRLKSPQSAAVFVCFHSPFSAVLVVPFTAASRLSRLLCSPAFFLSFIR